LGCRFSEERVGEGDETEERAEGEHSLEDGTGQRRKGKGGLVLNIQQATGWKKILSREGPHDPKYLILSSLGNS